MNALSCHLGLLRKVDTAEMKWIKIEYIMSLKLLMGNLGVIGENA